jgi:hypothetical protein
VEQKHLALILRERIDSKAVPAAKPCSAAIARKAGKRAAEVRVSETPGLRFR